MPLFQGSYTRLQADPDEVLGPCLALECKGDCVRHYFARTPHVCFIPLPCCGVEHAQIIRCLDCQASFETRVEYENEKSQKESRRTPPAKVRIDRETMMEQLQHVYEDSTQKEHCKSGDSKEQPLQPEVSHPYDDKLGADPDERPQETEDSRPDHANIPQTLEEANVLAPVQPAPTQPITTSEKEILLLKVQAPSIVSIERKRQDIMERFSPMEFKESEEQEKEAPMLPQMHNEWILTELLYNCKFSQAEMALKMALQGQNQSSTDRLATLCLLDVALNGQGKIVDSNKLVQQQILPLWRSTTNEESPLWFPRLISHTPNGHYLVEANQYFDPSLEVTDKGGTTSVFHYIFRAVPIKYREKKERIFKLQFTESKGLERVVLRMCLPKGGWVDIVSGNHVPDIRQVANDVINYLETEGCLQGREDAMEEKSNECCGIENSAPMDCIEMEGVQPEEDSRMCPTTDKCATPGGTDALNQQRLLLWEGKYIQVSAKVPGHLSPADLWQSSEDDFRQRKVYLETVISQRNEEEESESPSTISPNAASRGDRPGISIGVLNSAMNRRSRS